MSDPQEDPDVRAMSRLREGEDLALDEIMDRWQGRLMSYLFRLTGTETVAIDLAQDTFVRVYQHRERYRATGAFSSWLFAIATNLARQHTRWKMRHHSISMNARFGERPHGVEALPAPDPGPGDPSGNLWPGSGSEKRDENLLLRSFRLLFAGKKPFERG